MTYDDLGIDRLKRKLLYLARTQLKPPLDRFKLILHPSILMEPVMLTVFNDKADGVDKVLVTYINHQNLATIPYTFNHHQLQQVLSKCVTVKSDLALNGQLTKSEICLGNINRQETNIQRLGKVVRTALCLIAAISASPIGLHKLHTISSPDQSIELNLTDCTSVESVQSQQSDGPDLNQPHLHLLMIAWAGFNPRTNS
ncbi:hypothetical protein MJO29_004234 [Puccinia striiformis f. sp. tritici]|nr:hypothetical protein MJO29_004234 [Puccinia striiformis f. sp. tritici]